MLKNWQTLLIVLVVVGVSALVVMRAQGGATPISLTAMDYVEIEQLNYRYAHVLDGCLNKGYAYADLYTQDGVFTNQQGEKFMGRERLSQAARGGAECPSTRTPLNLSHVIVNVMIDPTPEGANGKSFLVHTALGSNGAAPNQLGLGTGGMYYDTYVKTPTGWRFRTRAYIEPPNVNMIPPGR